MNTTNIIRSGIASLLITATMSCGVMAAGQVSIRISADKSGIGMGECVTIKAMATLPGGKPASHYLLLPYINGKRWGSHEYTDANGKAQFYIPLPNVGIQEIEVRSAGEVLPPREKWIWAADASDGQTIYLLKEFDLSKPAVAGTLWIAVDDDAVVYLNGKEIAKKSGWREQAPIPVDASLLHKGKNAICIEGHNSGGPACALLHLDVQTNSGKQTIISDDTWRVYSSKDEALAESSRQKGESAKVIGVVENSNYDIDVWPGVVNRADLIGGKLKPQNGVYSNAVQVRVNWRKLDVLPKNPDQLIGMQWEEWFTPTNCYWQTAQAVPLMGFYNSLDFNVLRQQAIWMIECGADFLMADWSNNIWFLEDWDKRAPGFNELQLATSMMLETLAELRDEGQEVPKFTLLIGISHLLPNGVNAVNGQLNYIYLNYINNPRFNGLWQEYEGKPLIAVLDVPSTYISNDIKLDDRFTVRYVSAGLERTGFAAKGMWSWMDGADPIVTYKDGKAEATTASVGYFGADGWLYPPTKGRRNGATLLDTFRVAYEARPKVTFIHQFNEFAGQPEGNGYGPKHDLYVDSYSAELSDDMEPTSLTAPAYRGNGGWGFICLNYQRALVDLYRQKTPQTTVLAVSSPLRNSIVKENKLKVTWVALGKAAKSYTLRANGKVLVSGITGNEAQVDFSTFADGPVRLAVVAEGTKANYLYSWTENSRRLAKPVTAYAVVDFMLQRSKMLKQ